MQFFHQTSSSKQKDCTLEISLYRLNKQATWHVRREVSSAKNSLGVFELTMASAVFYILFLCHWYSRFQDCQQVSN
jgi:hypothetical protein